MVQKKGSIKYSYYANNNIGNIDKDKGEQQKAVSRYQNATNNLSTKNLCMQIWEYVNFKRSSINQYFMHLQEQRNCFPIIAIDSVKIIEMFDKEGQKLSITQEKKQILYKFIKSFQSKLIGFLNRFLEQSF